MLQLVGKKEKQTKNFFQQHKCKPLAAAAESLDMNHNIIFKAQRNKISTLSGVVFVENMSLLSTHMVFTLHYTPGLALSLFRCAITILK